MALITITLNINTPNGMPASQAVDYFCKNQGYQATLADGSANPETKAAFAKRKMAEWAMQIINAQRVEEARKAAGDTEAAKAPITVD